MRIAFFRVLTLAAGCAGGLVAAAAPAGAQAQPAIPACTITGAGLVVGTPGNDVLCGSSGDDILVGLGGNDIIRGFGGNDLLIGGPGVDVLRGGPGNDRLIDTSGASVVDGGPGTDDCIGRRQAQFSSCESVFRLGGRG